MQKKMWIKKSYSLFIIYLNFQTLIYFLIKEHRSIPESVYLVEVLWQPWVVGGGGVAPPFFLWGPLVTWTKPTPKL